MKTSATAIPARAVLLIEDNPTDAALVKHALSNVDNPGYSVEHVTQLSDALKRMSRGGIDVVILDLALADSSHLETLQAMCATAPIVVVTGHDDEPRAIGLLQHGAQDYLLKQEISPQLLARSIRYAIERRRAAALESLNQQLEQAKSSLTTAVRELERTNEDLAHFSYFASHDLQEPVRTINYFAGHLKDSIGDRLDDDARKDFFFILDAGRRMQALIHSLLTLSKVGNAEMEWGPVDLELCVNEAVECLAARIEESRAVIIRDSLPVVTGNRTLLAQLYQNLIGNAIKFTADRQPIVHLTAARNGEQWILGVQDNGIGIDSDFAQTIFAPFQRLNDRGKYEGTGLGLTICKKVVDRHGGRIWVESTPGAGAHFKFLLTAHDQAREPASVEASASSRPEVARLLATKWFGDAPTAGIRGPSPRIRRALVEAKSCLI